MSEDQAERLSDRHMKMLKDIHDITQKLAAELRRVSEAVETLAKEVRGS